MAGGERGNWQRPVKSVWQRTAGCGGDRRTTRAEETATPFSSVTAMVGCGRGLGRGCADDKSEREEESTHAVGVFYGGMRSGVS